MLTIIVLFAYYIISITSVITENVGCTISILYKNGDLREPQPLLLKRNNGDVTFWYPNNNKGILHMSQHDSIYLACPGRNNYVKYSHWGNEIKADCRNHKSFYVNGEMHHFSTLICRYPVEQHVMYANSPHCLGKNSRTIDIGFKLYDTFIHTIQLCRDQDTYVTYYAKSHLTKMIKSKQKNYPRPYRFLANDFYPWTNMDMDYLYEFDTQREMFTRILNSTELIDNKLIRKTQFLSRGHLVAKGDFVYGSQQSSTFWYMNTAPQWQTFNIGNWNNLESSVRHFAIMRNLNLDVYTGVYGQMTMKNLRGRQQPVYMHNNGIIMPVPKFFWKIIYDPYSKQGTAFVSLNDPFIEFLTADVYICDDISRHITWLRWRPTDSKLGISYACKIADLRKAVPTLPSLHVIGTLM